jgi:dihydrolipoamide dehydrogenase
MKTAIIEKYPVLGGTCLNVGCIPSKALLDSSEHYHNALHNFSLHGIRIKEAAYDLKAMIARKDEVVQQNTDGINFLMKKNKIDVITGHATLLKPDLIRITGSDGKSQEMTAAKVILATGSKPAPVKGINIDKKRIITSTEALNLKEVPQHLIVVGGGVIGLELGSVYARLGAKVSVIEFTDSIIGTMDLSLGKELRSSLQKLGFDFYTGHKLSSAESKGKEVSVSAEDKNGKVLNLKGDYCLLSVGRIPYTEGLGLQDAGIKTDERGRIIVNENLETSAKNVYAIGDVIKGAMLAHKAEEEGVFVAEHIAGQKPHINYLLIPSVVYTWPEVAAVGFTEEELKLQGREHNKGIFPFKASGRARASMDTAGFVKVIADKNTDEILGVHMIGPRVADMIAEAVVAMEFRASAEDIARMSHAHPTYTEAFREACLAATANRAIHI